MKKWVLDQAHSQIQFSVRHMGISTVRGTFDHFTGVITMDDAGEVTAVDVEIEIASISTRTTQRDNHLRSADFFDAEQFPKATFKLTSFAREGDDVTAVGNLTIRGITKPVTLTGEVGGPAVDPSGTEKVSADLVGKISRKEWGLVWNVPLAAGGVLVSDEVKLSIDIQASAEA